MSDEHRPLYEDEGFFEYFKDSYIPYPWNKALPEVKTFEARDGDVCIVSFPKSGTSWLSAVVLMVMNDADPSCLHSGKTVNSSVQMLEQVLPPEINRPDLRNIHKLKHTEGARLYATHLSTSAIPPSVLERAKVLYIVRNPKDVIVSMFHWLRGLKVVGFHQNIGYLVDQFVHSHGKIFYGPYFENVLGYWKIRDRENVFFCSYEEMIKDFPAMVGKIGSFLGKALTKTQIDVICHECSFEEMRTNAMTNRVERDTVLKVYDSTVSPYIRSGAVGKWRDGLDERCNVTLDRWIEGNLSRTELSGFSFQFE